MPFKSNLTEVAGEMRRISKCLSMHSRGRYRTIGEDVVNIVAQGIYDRTVLAQQDPNGHPLAPLAPATLEAKRHKGQPSTIGVATKEMLAVEQLKGTRLVLDNRVEMTYGESEAAQQKAEWFSEGRKRGKRRQPARPFYELDEAIEEDLDDLFDEVLAREIGA